VIVLDTHGLAALMQHKPDAQFVAWLNSQHAESSWISSITLFLKRAKGWSCWHPARPLGTQATTRRAVNPWTHAKPSSLASSCLVARG
jgi:hypothetical protein